MVLGENEEIQGVCRVCIVCYNDGKTDHRVYNIMDEDSTYVNKSPLSDYKWISS